MGERGVSDWRAAAQAGHMDPQSRRTVSSLRRFKTGELVSEVIRVTESSKQHP
jgi:hypothetical protein